MSILEKLKQLASAIESGSQEASQEDIQNIIDEISESEAEEESIEETPSYIECTPEETRAVLSLRNHAKEARAKLSDLLIEYENRKTLLITEIKKSESGFYTNLNILRERYGLPEIGYSVSVPDSDEGNIVFEKED